MQPKTRQQSIVGIVYGRRGGWIVVTRDATGDLLPTGGCHGPHGVGTAALLFAKSGNDSLLSLYKCLHEIAICIFF